LGNQDILKSDAATWRARLSAIPQKKKAGVCETLAALLKQEQDKRHALNEQARARDRYTVNATDLEAMNLEEFEVLAALLTTRLEVAPERFEILRRMNALPRLSERWQKWRRVPEAHAEEVIADVTRLVEIERARRAQALEDGGSDGEPDLVVV
jgi:hypothetical protein